MEDYINRIIAPQVRGDGGWVEFVSYKDHNLVLNFRGECSKCTILDRCLDWICQEVKRDLNEDITITPVRLKPFFWDHN
jgi:Fe-S cluster biogenesis protein NfuA